MRKTNSSQNRATHNWEQRPRSLVLLQSEHNHWEDTVLQCGVVVLWLSVEGCQFNGGSLFELPAFFPVPVL